MESGISILFGLISSLVSFLVGDLVISFKVGILLASSPVSYIYLVLAVFFCLNILRKPTLYVMALGA